MRTQQYYSAIQTTKHDSLVVWYDELYYINITQPYFFILGCNDGETYEHLYPKAHGLLDVGI